MVQSWVRSLYRPFTKQIKNPVRPNTVRGQTRYRPAVENLESRLAPAALQLYGNGDLLGDIAVYDADQPDDTSGNIRSDLPTWLVIHGRGSERDSDDMSSLTLALSQARPGEQVLTLDWSELAGGSLSFDQDHWIEPIAEAAAIALRDHGPSGGNLHIVGHSWGAYIGAEIAERLPVHSIVAIDPGCDGLAFYDPEADQEIDFTRDTEYSWTFFESGGDPLGSRVTPRTADEQFVIRHSGHGDVTEVIASVLRLPEDNPLRQAFDLNRLVNQQAGPWTPDRYDGSGDLETPSPDATPYDAVLEADHTGRDLFSLRYIAGNSEVSLLNGGNASVFHGLRFESTGQFGNSPVRIGLAPTGGEAFTPLVRFDDGVTFNNGAASFVGHGTAYGIIAGHSFPVWPGGNMTVQISDWLDPEGNLSLNWDGGSFSLAGVEFEVEDLSLVYTPDDRLSLSGEVSISVGDTTVSAELGDGNTPGVLIDDGELQSVHASIEGDFTIGMLNFTSDGLQATYSIEDGRESITFTGGASVTIGGQSIEVDFGGDGSTGLVVQDGVLTRLDVAIDSDITIGGLHIETNHLGLTYEAPSAANGNAETFIIRGAAAFSLASNSVAIQLGGPDSDGTGSDGIVIRNGVLERLAATVSSNIVFGGLTFTVDDLRVVYEASGETNIVSITGGTSFHIGNSEIAVHFGGDGTDGLVLEDGQLQRLTMSVTADIDLKGLHFGVRDLTIGYDPGASRFIMYGDVFLSTAGASPTLNQMTASLGNASNPGLVIVGGDLQSLNIGLSGSFSLFGVTLTAENLNVQYVSSTGILQLQGGVAVQLSTFIHGSVSLPNGGITINTNTGAIQVNGLRMEFDVQFGAFRIDDLFVEYTDNRPSGGVVIISAGGTVTLPGGFSVGGEFTIAGGHVTDIALFYDADSSTGIALGNTGLYLTHLGGSLEHLDNLSLLTVNADVEVTFAKTISFLGREGKLFVATGSLSVSAQRLEIHGDVALVAVKEAGDTRYVGLLGEGSVDLSIDWTRGIYQATVTNMPVWGIFTLSGSLTFTNSGDFTITAEVGVVVPSAIPVIGGMTLAGAGFYLQVRPNTTTLTDDFAAAWVDLGFLGQYGFKIDFTGDTFFLDSEDIENLGNASTRAASGQYLYAYHFYVPDNVTFARFQVRLEALRFDNFLTSAGQMIGVADTPSYFVYSVLQNGSEWIITPPGQFDGIVSRHKDAPDSWVLMLGRADGSVTVPAGSYTVYITSMSPLTGIWAPQVTPFYQYRKPTIAITGVEIDDNANVNVSLAPASYAVGTLPTAQTPSQTTIRIYYDDTADGSLANRSGYNGTLIQTLPYAVRSGSSNVVTTSYQWQELLDLSPDPYVAGPYYLYAAIDDGVNEPVYSAYSQAVVPPEPVTITAPSVQGYNPHVPLVFSAANGNAIVLSQEGLDTTVRVILEAPGHMNLRSLFEIHSRLELTGSAQEITALLEGMEYLPRDSHLTETLSISAAALTPTRFAREKQIELVPLSTDLAVALHAPLGTVLEGSTIAINATVTNQAVPGTTDATGVRVTVPLPAGLKLASATPSLGSYDAFTGVWTVGVLAHRASAQLALQVKVDAGTHGQTLLVGATTSSDSLDLFAGDNTATIGVDIGGQVNTAPTEILLSSTSISENSQPGTIVGVVSSIDSPGDAHTFELIQNSRNLFTIEGKHLRVAAGARLDHEAMPSTVIVVRARDQSGLAFDRQFTIKIVDVNEQPVVQKIAPIRIAENQSMRFFISAVDPDVSDTLTYSLLTAVLDGPTLEPNGDFHWTPTEKHGGNVFLLWVRATDQGGLSAIQTFSIAVDENNMAPVLNPIPRLIVNEGDLTSFTASATDGDQPQNTLTYAWTSLSRTPIVGATIDPATGRFGWIPEDNGSFTGEVSVTDDGEPHRAAKTNFTIVVKNLAPMALIEGPQNSVRGQPRQFRFHAIDPSLADRKGGFTYEIDWGDGTRQTIRRKPGSNGEIMAEHIYAKVSAYVIKATAQDKDGGKSQVVLHAIQIHAMQLQGSTLVIGGTRGVDRIQVTRYGPDRIKVQFDRSFATFSGVRRIVFYGQGGKDRIQVPAKLRLPVAIHTGKSANRQLNDVVDLLLRKDLDESLGAFAGRQST